MSGLRLAFMGSPDLAVTVLQGLVEWCESGGHVLAAVYTQPPRPAGRGGKLRKSPVHELAERIGLDIRTPETLKDKTVQQEFAALDLDVAVVAAYGQILPKAFLDAPRYGCINVHASLLPRWRGAAPIQRAIMAGDEETGVSIMRMDEGLDTGDVYTLRRIAIEPSTTASLLHDQLAALSIEPLVVTLNTLPHGLTPVPQPAGGVTYADKIDKREARIDWSKNAADVDNHIRGLSVWPGAWFQSNDERVKVLMSELTDGEGEPGTILSLDGGITVACGSGAVRLIELQRAGKSAMDAATLLRGYPLELNARLD